MNTVNNLSSSYQLAFKTVTFTFVFILFGSFAGSSRTIQECEISADWKKQKIINLFFNTYWANNTMSSLKLLKHTLHYICL